MVTRSFAAIALLPLLTAACSAGSPALGPGVGTVPPADGGADGEDGSASHSTDATAPDTDGGATLDAAGQADSSGSPEASLGVTCTGASPSFATAVHPILSTSCGGELCHGGTAAGAWPYNALVNARATRDTCASAGIIVVPGSLDQSYLIHKLTGVDICPGTAQMPKTGHPLPTNEIQTIADWICAGAMND